MRGWDHAPVCLTFYSINGNVKKAMKVQCFRILEQLIEFSGSVRNMSPLSENAGYRNAKTTMLLMDHQMQYIDIFSFLKKTH